MSTTIRSYSGGKRSLEDLTTGKTHVTKLPSATTSIDDAVEDIEAVTTAAGLAALCSAYTIKEVRGADLVNIALADILATVATAVAMAAQSIHVVLEEGAGGAGAKNHRPFSRVNAEVNPSRATLGAHAARTTVAGYRQRIGWFQRVLLRGLSSFSSSSPASWVQVWLWWPLAWLFHWMLVGPSPMARDMPRCSIHELWESAIDAARTATAAADNAVAASGKRDKITNVTVGYTPYTGHEPQVKIFKPLPGIDAHDVQRLRTAAGVADAAAAIAHTLASSALGASNSRQARRAARASEAAAAAALRARSAYTTILYKIEALSVENEDSSSVGISAPNDKRRFADRLGRWCDTMDTFQSPSADITSLDERSHTEHGGSFHRHYLRYKAAMSLFFTVDYVVVSIREALCDGHIVVVDGPSDDDDDNNHSDGDDDGPNDDKEDIQDESLSDSNTVEALDTSRNYRKLL